jgi:hypothetical protein
MYVILTDPQFLSLSQSDLQISTRRERDRNCKPVWFGYTHIQVA